MGLVKVNLIGQIASTGHRVLTLLLTATSKTRCDPWPRRYASALVDLYSVVQLLLNQSVKEDNSISGSCGQAMRIIFIDICRSGRIYTSKCA